MDNNHPCYGTGRSRQTPDDVLSESQMMSRFFLDHEERVISLVSADAFQIYKQSGGIDWLIMGPIGEEASSFFRASTAVNEVGCLM